MRLELQLFMSKLNGVLSAGVQILNLLALANGFENRLMSHGDSLKRLLMQFHFRDNSRASSGRGGPRLALR